MRPVVGRRRGFTQGAASPRIRRITTVIIPRRGAPRVSIVAGRRLWGVLRRILGGLTTWRGTFGSGRGIGLALILPILRQTPEALIRARKGCFAAGVGVMTSLPCGRRSAAT